MNLVEQIKHQLSSGVIKELSSVLGVSEGTTGAAVNAAVPALLSALSGMVSSSSGSQKLVSALGQLGSGSLDNLSQKLSNQPSSVLEQGAEHPELAFREQHDLRDRQRPVSICQHRARGGAEAARLPDAAGPGDDRVEIHRQVDERSRPGEHARRPEGQYRQRPALRLLARATCRGWPRRGRRLDRRCGGSKPRVPH